MMIGYAAIVVSYFAADAVGFFIYTATLFQREDYRQFLFPSRTADLVALSPQFSISTETNLDHW
jgi:hypothetical protein